MKKIKIKLWHILTFSLIIGIIVSILVGMLDSQFLASLKKDYPSQKEYSILKEYASDYAKTLDSTSIKNDNISISHTVRDGILSVKVETSRCNLEANYLLKEEIVGNGTFITQVSFDKVNYTETSNINSIGHTICILVAICLLYTMVSTIVISEVFRGLEILDKKKKTT